MKRTLPAFLLILSLFVQSCAHMPGSKEPTDAEINGEASKAYAEVKSKSKISTNKEWTEMVQRVAGRIAKSSGENFQWEYVLLENPEPNAWCMPGGKIAVYTGIMPILKTEAALAAVLGHEVAHATRRHGQKGYARAMTNRNLGLLIGGAAVVGSQFLCKDTKCRILAGLGGAAAGFAVYFFDRKFSRVDETEADKYGQIYMARAGYDPSESIRLWERMSAAMNGKAPPEWMSTHPSDTTRRANLSSWLPEANAVYAQSPQKFGLGQPVR